MKSTLLRKHFTSYIAKTLRQKTAADLHKARFVSVMSDFSTDTTIVVSVIILCVGYVDPWQCRRSAPGCNERAGYYGTNC